MSIEQKLCEVKIFQLRSMLNTIRCIDQRFVFKNFVSGLDIQLKNPVAGMVAGGKFQAKYDESYTIFFLEQLIPFFSRQ